LNTTATALSVLAGLVVLAGIAGGLWAVARNAAKDKTEERLRAENIDLTRRLDWVEPRLKTAEEQNAMLTELHNPTKQIEAATIEGREQRAKIIGLLEAQRQTLVSIEQQVEGRPR
jgi:hypothetical protein